MMQPQICGYASICTGGGGGLGGVFRREMLCVSMYEDKLVFVGTGVYKTQAGVLL